MKQRTFKLKEFAQDISVAVKDAQLSPLKRFVGLEHYDSNEPVITRFTDTSLLSSSVKEFCENDILIARRNVYLRRAGIVFFSGLTSGDSIVLRIYNDCEERTGIPKDDAIRIIPFILNSNDFWAYANKHADGMNSKRISKDMLYDYEFSLPPIEEQRILAEKLWAAYRLKESYKKLLTATQEMVKSQFIEMFKGKEPNGKIADLVYTSINSVKKSFNKEDSIEYIDISSVNAKSHTLSNTTQYIVNSAPSRAQQCVQIGDILVSTVRPINRNIAVLDCDLKNIVASTGFCVLRPKEGYREYLLSIVTSDKYTDKMCDIASGGLYPAVNNGDVLSYEIFIPDEDFLSRITRTYRQADKSEFVGCKSQFIEMFGGESNKVPFEEIVVVKDDCRRPINEGVRSEMKDGELYPYYGATGVVDYINDYLTDDELLCIAEDCGNYNAGEESAYIIRGKAWVNNHAHLVKTKEACDVKYLYYFLKIADLKPYVSGTTRLKLTQKKLKKISVTLPSTDKQKTFVKIAEQADKSEFELRKSIEAIDQVIKSLINN